MCLQQCVYITISQGNWWGFPSGSVVKNPPANAGDLGSIPGWGKSPGGGNGNPLQYSCLETPMDQRAWWATAHWASKNQTRLTWLSTDADMQAHVLNMHFPDDCILTDDCPLWEASLPICAHSHVSHLSLCAWKYAFFCTVLSIFFPILAAFCIFSLEKFPFSSSVHSKMWLPGMFLFLFLLL